MAEKRNKFLSNMLNKISGDGDPYSVDDESWKKLQKEEDIDVLALDDSVPARNGGSQPGAVKPELTLTPDIPDDEYPDISVKPEMTLTPDLPEEPELTLTPEIPEEPVESAETPAAGEPAGPAPEEPPVPEAEPEIPEEGGDAPEEEKKGRFPWSSLRPKRRETEEEAEQTEEPQAAPEPQPEPPEDEDYEFDDSSTAGTAKALLGSTGTLAAGIGMSLLGILKVIGGFLRDFFVTIGAATWAYLRHELRVKNLKNLFSRYLLSFVIIYYEMVLKFSTTRKPFGFAILYIVLFSICWGLLGYLLTTILRPAANRTARKVLILLLAIPFLVNYFRYQQMGMFLGLADTAAGNGRNMTWLIFSLSGLAHIALFLLPFLVYTLVLYRVDKARRIKFARRVRTILSILALWFITWLLVLANGNYREAYSKEYTYESAVSSFGLLSSLRLDVMRQLHGSGRKPASAPVAVPEQQTEDETAETVPETTLPYDPLVDPEPAAAPETVTPESSVPEGETAVPEEGGQPVV